MAQVLDASVAIAWCALNQATALTRAALVDVMANGALVPSSFWYEVFQLSIYDAGYLELALRSGLPLATTDKALASAARDAGVTVVSAVRGSSPATDRSRSL